LAAQKNRSPLANPHPERGHLLSFTIQERGWIEEARRLHIVGSPKTVKAGIENLAARTQADEIIISTMIHDHRKRRRSYELIARAFALDQGEGFW
jgi:alkanesulfonate monooxygenase SsuD/methylene tetrahydromethanopterin reductase-like flavin-dependent oxidoreductase (luciferase family)